MIRFLLFTFLFASSLNVNAKEVELRKLPVGPYGEYLNEVLTTAYSRLGYTINYIDIPGIRELQFVSEGRLSAVLARSSVIEQAYPNLIKVSAPILQYQVLMYSDRRACGYCLPQNLTEVVYPRSGLLYKSVVSELPSNIKKITVGANSDIESLLLKGRVSAAILSPLEDMQRVESSPHFLKRAIRRGNLNHYLSPELIKLQQPLQQIFLQMETDGSFDKLKLKYDIYNYKEVTPFTQEKLIAVAGEWVDYTESDGSGTYWEMLNSVFKSSFTIEPHASTWERSVRLFEKGKADILVGAYQGAPSGYLQSDYHIDYESDVIAIAKNKDVLDSFFRGRHALNVCTPRPFELSIKQKNSMSNIYVASVDTCLTLFNNDRMDIAIQYPYDLPLSNKTVTHTRVFLESEPLFVMFQNNEKGQYLKTVFDRNMERLAADGKLENMFPSADLYKAANIN